MTRRLARVSAGALCLERQLFANLFANPVENMQLVMHGCQASPGRQSRLRRMLVTLGELAARRSIGLARLV